MPYVSHAALTGWFNTHSRPVLWKQISFHSFNVGAEFQHVFTEIYAMHLSLVRNRIGILLPKLFWPTVRKNCSSDWEKLLKFEAEGQEFAKLLRSLEQFI